MLYGRVYGHSSGLVEYRKAGVLKGYGNFEAAVGLEEALVLKTEHYHVPFFHRIYAAYHGAVAGDTALTAFKPCQQPS